MLSISAKNLSYSCRISFATHKYSSGPKGGDQREPWPIRGMKEQKRMPTMQCGTVVLVFSNPISWSVIVDELV